MKTDLILLASGYSRRFQGNKLLYELDGMPLIAHTLQKLSTLNPHSLIVVTQYEEVEKLARDYNAVWFSIRRPEKDNRFPYDLELKEVLLIRQCCVLRISRICAYIHLRSCWSWQMENILSVLPVKVF